MEGMWRYVYSSGEWFWRHFLVILLLSLFEGGLFLWFSGSLRERWDRLWINLAQKALFLALCIFLQFQMLHVAYHCLLFLALWTGFLLLSRSCGWKDSLFTSTVFCLMTESAKLLTKDGLMASVVVLILPWVSSGSQNGLLLAFYLLLLSTFAFFIRTQILRHEQLNISGPEAVCLSFPLALYLLVRNLQFLYMGGDDYLWIYLQIVQMASATCALILIVMTEKNLSIERERNELMKMELLLRQQQQQYLVRRETMEIINSKYHDLKHYLSGIEALKLQEAQNYVQAMRREIEPIERYQETGSQVLDILLTQRIQECQEKGIRLTSLIDGRRLDFIHSLDLCSIFGNAMDNAIEAAAELPDSGLRGIQVKIGVSDQLAFLCFRNYFDGILKRSGSQLLTRKNDTASHGYGIKNIRRLAEKYGGTAAFEVNGKKFTLNVMVPLPKNED